MFASLVSGERARCSLRCDKLIAKALPPTACDETAEGQTWVDNIGGQHDYWGHLENGNMAFIGDTPAPNGKLGRVPTRLTFFHIGKDSVRQFSEISSDSGKTWTTNYDLMYVRRSAGRVP
jgi:hypothetical protein